MNNLIIIIVRDETADLRILLHKNDVKWIKVMQLYDYENYIDETCQYDEARARYFNSLNLFP